MSPLVGVVGETGDVLAIRARGNEASPRRKLDRFIDECVAAIPTEARANYEPPVSVVPGWPGVGWQDQCRRPAPGVTREPTDLLGVSCPGFVRRGLDADTDPGSQLAGPFRVRCPARPAACEPGGPPAPSLPACSGASTPSRGFSRVAWLHFLSKVWSLQGNQGGSRSPKVLAMVATAATCPWGSARVSSKSSPATTRVLPERLARNASSAVAGRAETFPALRDEAWGASPDSCSWASLPLNP